MEFSGRANILMNGVMMGFSKREILSKVDAIIDFAELGAYIDEPVRTYSSGMGLRLGFGVAVSVDPDVLIIDEVFAVGDMYFQKKCVDKIYEFKKRNKTIMFCSHSLYDVRQLCDDAIWLDHGICKAIGNSIHVTNEYSAFQRQNIDEAKDLLDDDYPSVELDPDRPRQTLPSIRDARIYRMGSDQEVYEITTGDSIEIRIWWRNPRPEETPIHLGVGFLRQDMTTCGGMGTNLDGLQVKGTEGCAIIRIPDVHLLSGQFLLPILLLDEGGVHKYQEFLMPDNLTVRTDTRDVGLFRLEHSWEFCDREPPRPQEQDAQPMEAGG